MSIAEGQKYYVLLFTCLSVRAIHLEVTHSLNMKDFLLAFDRFSSRRGVPSLVRSDNAKTFKCAAEHLTAKLRLTWKFSVERVPWTGGSWERMVRSVKTSLKFALKKDPVSYVDLQTYICRVEQIVNRRPITFVDAGVDDLRPLSPSDFLAAKFPVNPVEPPTRHYLLQSLICSSRSASIFWRRWKREYLRGLLRNNTSGGHNPIKADDVVLLDDGSKRQFWPLCRVVETLRGRDGRVRTVRIKCNGKHLTRPTRLLYNLEV